MKKQRFMERKKTVENYEAPVMEVIEVEVEKGFAVSNEGWGEGPEILIP